MLWLIITLLVVGLIAGAIARLLVPGRDRIGFRGTLLIGVIGSFVGGFLGYLMFHHHADKGALQPSGLLGSIVGAIIVLLLYRRFGSSRGVSRR
jgi:uncharacterized membrane protein YeaQ/YmgE (transglycosylase-associated protein family)